MLQRTLAVVGLSLVLYSCGSKDSKPVGTTPTSDPGATTTPVASTEATYLTTVAAGKIGGSAWTFGSGRVDVPSASDTTKRYNFTFVSNVIEKPCSEFIFTGSDKKAVFFSYETLQAGEVQLSGTSKTITFYDNSAGNNMNNATDNAKWSIDSITATTVSGKFLASMADNEINGTFSIAKCCKDPSGFGYQVCTQ